ncbi:MAG: hypothetical protein CME62_17250 [Halobacteriovoraceae bacterium]|nr:hypothetical protein [Halobacteriovoraceae bacterium]|tara:strand:+ start:4433 stop:5248 length:816 start_codon:yes stop_codon:yes gene_type:complete
MRVLCILIFILSFATFANDKDPVVATVNGKKINQSTLMMYHEQNLRFVRANRKVTLESSLNDLINRIIGIESAKKANMDKQPEVKKKMNDVMYHAYISKEITPLLKKIDVKEKDIKAYYNDNPEYRTSQILLRLRAQPTKDEVAEVFEKALNIHNELKKDPEKFTALAQQYGQTSTSQAGGDLGYQPATRLSAEYYSAIKGKKVGTIVEPFRSQYGIHIVKITGKKEYKQIDQDLYKKIVYDIKRDEILENYFDKLRAKANVKINKKDLKI